MTRLLLTFFSGLLFLACAGCGKSSVAVAEGKERNSVLYRRALEAERAGDIKEAIRLYRNLLIDEPRAFSVHLQLATLLQDFEENYIAALYHYQQYLLLRPTSDKTTLAQDRIRRAEQLLAPQILRKVGDSVEGLTQAHLLKENDRLNRLIVQLQSEKTDLTEASERAERERAAAVNETERLRDILNRMRVTDTVERPPATTPRRSEDTTRVERPDANALQALRNEAAALAAEGNRAATPAPRNATAEDVLRNAQQRVSGDTTPRTPPTPRETPPPATPLSALLGNERASQRPAPTPTLAEPRTYTVQPGDTLFRIAERYYGDSTHWKRIRDANRTRIDPDGRVRAGQILVIP